jgi:hypothetical protein
VNQLRADWQAIRAKGRRRPVGAKTGQIPDLHEDWAAVKGDKYPPYAFLVQWFSATELTIFKMRVMGKGRSRDGVRYRVQPAGVFFRSPNSKFRLSDMPPANDSYPRHLLCFTQEDVTKAISRARSDILGDLAREHRRINAAMRELSERLKDLEGALDEARKDPLPERLLKTLPRKASKRLERA